MYRTYLAVLVAACTAVLLGVPATNAERTIGAESNGLSICEETYLANYAKAHEEFGAEAVGANLVDDGVGEHEAYNLPESLVCAKADVLDGMLHPPEPTYSSSESTTEPAATEAAPTSGGYAIPESIVACESGGDYSAVNPSSGATGAYQIMPSTASAYGCDLSTPAGQDACAAEIYADVGSSAWVCG